MGDHTASISQGDVTAAATFTIEPKELTVTKVIVYSGYYGDETMPEL